MNKIRFFANNKMLSHLYGRADELNLKVKHDSDYVGIIEVTASDPALDQIVHDFFQPMVAHRMLVEAGVKR
jgi:hypothetical protein